MLVGQELVTSLCRERASRVRAHQRLAWRRRCFLTAWLREHLLHPLGLPGEWAEGQPHWHSSCTCRNVFPSAFVEVVQKEHKVQIILLLSGISFPAHRNSVSTEGLCAR